MNDKMYNVQHLNARELNKNSNTFLETMKQFKI